MKQGRNKFSFKSRWFCKANLDKIHFYPTFEVIHVQQGAYFHEDFTMYYQIQFLYLILSISNAKYKGKWKYGIYLAFFFENLKGSTKYLSTTLNIWFNIYTHGHSTITWWAIKRYMIWRVIVLFLPEKAYLVKNWYVVKMCERSFQ